MNNRIDILEYIEYSINRLSNTGIGNTEYDRLCKLYERYSVWYVECVLNRQVDKTKTG